MMLLDLPYEILICFADHLRNIEDFLSFSSTCRTLHATLSKTNPHTILQLASRSAPTFFSPHPYFLTVATARGAARAALGNEDLTKDLHEAFQAGISGLYKFCLKHSGITLEDLRRWHLARFSVINPLSDRIDKMAGKQWYQTPDFWDGGVSEAVTLNTDADRCTFQLIIYGELFQESLRSFIEPRLGLPYFKLETRFQYVKYCIPDWYCRIGYPGMDVRKDEGPYTGTPVDEEGSLMADQQALDHVLECGRWQRMWQALLRQVGEDFADLEIVWDQHVVRNAETPSEMRQILWWNAAVVCGGIDGLSAITTLDENGTMTPETRSRLVQIRKNIEDLDEEYLLRLIRRTEMVGTHEGPQTMVAAHPELSRELWVCMRGGWWRNPNAVVSDNEEDVDDEG